MRRERSASFLVLVRQTAALRADEFAACGDLARLAAAASAT